MKIGVMKKYSKMYLNVKNHEDFLGLSLMNSNFIIVFIFRFLSFILMKEHKKEFPSCLQKNFFSTKIKTEMNLFPFLILRKMEIFLRMGYNYFSILSVICHIFKNFKICTSKKVKFQ